MKFLLQFGNLHHNLQLVLFRLQDLNAVEQLIEKMGYEKIWLKDRDDQEKDTGELMKQRLRGIKRKLQYNYSNRLSYCECSLLIQEKIYDQLLTRLKEQRGCKGDVVVVLEQLCAEGIPFQKRQEIYLELLDCRSCLESVRDDFIGYSACYPAREGIQMYSHQFSDVYVSDELNQNAISAKNILSSLEYSLQTRDSLYKVIFSEAKYYTIAFDVDYEYPFQQEQQMAYRILRVLSFVMQIQSMNPLVQFFSSHHDILNKCLIINANIPQIQESESFWLFYSILATFNSSKSVLSKYFHLIDSATNFQRISSIIGTI